MSTTDRLTRVHQMGALVDVLARRVQADADAAPLLLDLLRLVGCALEAEGERAALAAEPPPEY